MAITGGVPMAHDVVFPNGAFIVGEVSAVEDFKMAQAARESGSQMDTQARDKETGERIWQVRVIDGDEEARRGQHEVTVKFVAPVQPIPPATLPGLPFRPVEFVGLVGTPWVDTSRTMPRLMWSFRATDMRSPSRQTAGRSPASGANSAPPATPAGEGKAA